MSNFDRPLGEIMKEIIDGIAVYTGGDLNDDIIMIGVEREGRAARLSVTASI